MAKLKEYPSIFLKTLKNFIKGDFSQVFSDINNGFLYFLDRNLDSSSQIRYVLWQRNNSKKTDSVITPSNIKFAIVYFPENAATSLEKLTSNLKIQTYTNFQTFIWNEEIASQIKDFSHVIFIENGDTVPNHALNAIAVEINKDSDLELIYSDEDVINRFGIRTKPYFKTGYAPLLLFGHNYLNSLLCLKINNNLINELKNISELNQEKIYKLILKLTRKEIKIKRIPDVLYHRSWKNYKKLMNSSTRHIIQEEISVRKLNAEILDYKYKNYNRLKFKPLKESKISIIIPFKDKIELLENCINSIESKSTYKNYEIILVNNRSEKAETLKYLEKTKYKVLNADFDFNYSKLNNITAEIAEGEYLLLLNNDTEVISQDWMENMLGLAQLPKVGAVGAKLLYSDGSVQHAGVITRKNGATHVYRYSKDDFSWYKNYLDLIREYSCLTGACIMISKEKYLEMGGMNEDLIVEWSDTDLCLKLVKAGYYNVYCSHCILYHYEKSSRKNQFKSSRQQEIDYIMNTWGSIIAEDLFHNPNFSNKRSGFDIRIR